MYVFILLHLKSANLVKGFAEGFIRIVDAVGYGDNRVRQKRQNRTGCTESPERLPVLALFIYKKKSITTVSGKSDPQFIGLQKDFTDVSKYIRILRPITLPWSLAHMGNE